MSKQRRRDTTLTIRLTKAEKERIERNAKRAGRSITDYLVLLSLETPIHVAEDVKPLTTIIFRTKTRDTRPISTECEQRMRCGSKPVWIPNRDFYRN